MEIQGDASRRLSLETKTNKTLCAGAKGLGPLPFVGVRACERLSLSPPSSHKGQILLRRILRHSKGFIGFGQEKNAND